MIGYDLWKSRSDRDDMPDWNEFDDDGEYEPEELEMDEQDWDVLAERPDVDQMEGER